MNLWPKILILLTFLAFTQSALATDEAKFQNYEITAGPDGDEEEYYVDEPSSDSGSSESDPLNVYLPFNDDGETTQNFVTIDSHDNIIGYDGAGNFTGKIDINITASASSSTDKIFVFIENSSSEYEFVQENTTTLSTSSDTSTTITVSVDDICGKVDCTSMNDLSSVTEVEVDFMLHFIVTESGDYSGTNTIPSGTSYDGVYLKLNFKALKTPAPEVDLESVSPGDQQLIVKYSVDNDFGNEIKKHYAVINPTPPTSVTTDPVNGASNTATYDELYDVESTDTSAVVKVKDLKNDISYDISIIEEDKYKLSSFMSVTKSGTPLDIEEVLDGSSCFFLTAGFGYVHPVVNAFRFIRDEFLLKTTLGKAFVYSYYKIAKPLAPFVYNNKYLALGFRVMAYIWLFGISLISLIATSLLVGSVVSFTRQFKRA